MTPIRNREAVTGFAVSSKHPTQFASRTTLESSATLGRTLLSRSDNSHHYEVVDVTGAGTYAVFEYGCEVATFNMTALGSQNEIWDAAMEAVNRTDPRTPLGKEALLPLTQLAKTFKVSTANVDEVEDEIAELHETDPGFAIGMDKASYALWNQYVPDAVSTREFLNVSTSIEPSASDRALFARALKAEPSPDKQAGMAYALHRYVGTDAEHPELWPRGRK